MQIALCCLHALAPSPRHLAAIECLVACLHSTAHIHAHTHTETYLALFLRWIRVRRGEKECFTKTLLLWKALCMNFAASTNKYMHTHTQTLVANWCEYPRVYRISFFTLLCNENHCLYNLCAPWLTCSCMGVFICIYVYVCIFLLFTRWLVHFATSLTLAHARQYGERQENEQKGNTKSNNNKVVEKSTSLSDFARCNVSNAQALSVFATSEMRTQTLSKH